MAYPFGYGLSYTTFSYSDFTLTEQGGLLTAQIKVTNEGTVSGKDAVGLYYQAPYTEYDREKGVEKASVNLADFAKTKELAPGESELLSFTFNAKDTMKSYDAGGVRGYIMEPGTYYVTIAQDAHEAVNQILSLKGYDTGHGMTSEGNLSLAGTYEVNEFTEIEIAAVIIHV